MRKILVFILLGHVALYSSAQATKFMGSVVDADNGTYLYNAIVSIEGTSLSKTTNAQGEFVFNESIPIGEQVVTVSREGYEVKYLLINISNRGTVIENQIGIRMTKKERKKREKIAKSLDKEKKKREKDRVARLKEAKKEHEKREKELAKIKKKLKKKNKDVVVDYKNTNGSVNDMSVSSIGYEGNIASLQSKYAKILGVSPNEITNIPLYEFIDSWIGTPYLLGGATKDGIDCSSFTQRLFTHVYGMYIERTAEKQKKSKNNDMFTDQSFLREGDLLFFGELDRRVITHVGVYLGNNKFVNATSRRTNGISGVKIDDLSDGFWQSIYCCAGRRKVNN